MLLVYFFSLALADWANSANDESYVCVCVCAFTFM